MISILGKIQEYQIKEEGKVLKLYFNNDVVHKYELNENKLSFVIEKNDNKEKDIALCSNVKDESIFDKIDNTLNVNLETNGENYSNIFNLNAYESVRPGSKVADDNTLFSTAYGTIDVIWLDTDNNVIKEPNSPSSSLNGMKPVVFNESTSEWDEISESSSNWYNYLSNKWANAKTNNDSYFVWIPRYAYRITYYTGSTTDSNGITTPTGDPTGYYDGYGMWKAEDGKLKYVLDSGIETVSYHGMKYMVHPAFETDLEMGGWNSDLSGFWFAKFEMGGIETNLNTTYGTESLRNQTIGIQYETARKATYGMTTGLVTENEGENSYTSFMNSHMCKNSEWGAVAYLTHSQYGRNGTEVTINKSSLYYRGGGTDKAYITNVLQSTTGNVYGIYDMSGGTWERVAAFNSEDEKKYLFSHDWTTATGLTVDSSSTKFATKYNNTIGSYKENVVVYKFGKVGDATKEVNKGGKNSGASTAYMVNWFGDYASFTYSDYPFFFRGGNCENGVGAGVFCSHHYEIGYTDSSFSFRTVLCP